MERSRNIEKMPLTESQSAEKIAILNLAYHEGGELAQFRYRQLIDHLSATKEAEFAYREARETVSQVRSGLCDEMVAALDVFSPSSVKLLVRIGEDIDASIVPEPNPQFYSRLVLSYGISKDFLAVAPQNHPSYGDVVRRHKTSAELIAQLGDIMPAGCLQNEFWRVYNECKKT